MTLALSPAELQALVADAGLIGWKPSIHRHPEARGYVAVLAPPDFRPHDPNGPRLVTGRGDDHAGALARAIETAQARAQANAQAGDQGQAA